MLNNQLWIRHELAAAALFQIVQRMNLAGHFQVVAINRIVPAFDVNRAAKTIHPQNADHVGPIRLAEAGRAVMNVLFPSPDAAVRITSQNTVASLP